MLEPRTALVENDSSCTYIVSALSTASGSLNLWKGECIRSFKNLIGFEEGERQDSLPLK